MVTVPGVPTRLEVIVPLFARVEPFTFIVMVLLEETVTPAATVDVLVVVVVTAPPLKFRVAVPAPVCPKVRVLPAVGVILMVPPVVETVALVVPVVALINRSVAPPPELIDIAEAPEPVKVPPLPKVSNGVLMTKLAPPATVKVLVLTSIIPEAF